MDPSKNFRTKRLIAGILAANLMGIVIIMFMWVLSLALDRYLGPEQGGAAYLATSAFVLIPIAMGALTAFLWHPLELSTGAITRNSALSLIVSYVLCGIVLKEGIICLLMALPLVAAFQMIGYAIGKGLANRKNRRLNATLAPLLLTLIVTNVLTTRGFDGQVTDTIVIHAKPEKVWRYIAGYPAITAPPDDYWLWKVGLPAPVQSTATGYKVGSERKCIFTGNIAVIERISAMTPEKELTFDVTAQPKDPEISGHFVLHRGQFLLKDNGDGTTTVTGTSWYTLNVHPVCYYDLWTQDIVRHVHLRVMRHIKTLSETTP